MDLQLKGKTALVCASSKGLGLAVAQGLAAEGVNLVMCARGEEDLVARADEIRAKWGVKVSAVALDLAQPGATAKLVDVVRQQVGSVDILVNNIGGPPPSSARDTSAEAWQRGFEQIFLSSTLLTTALVPGMAERGFGRVLTITSLSVVEPIENLVVSTAMRAAVTTFSKTLSQEVARDGITVNTLMPGVIHTERIVNLRKSRAERLGTDWQDEMDKTRRTIPTGRLGEPEELAALAVFLASPRASYLTGLNIPIDGGLRKGW